MKKNLFSTFLVFVSTITLAQLKPEITGDNMLCPEGTGVVNTQEFEAYQWYRRYFGSTETLAIEGATSQNLEIDYYHFAASYISVEVTQEGESATSPEFFVDGHAFLPAVVMSEGQYYVNENDEFVICPDDVILFTLMMPYTENITWYRNGVVIDGETGTTLEVTAPGAYYVEGAPAVCPDFLQGPGLELVVVYCSEVSAPGTIAPKLTVGPIPASEKLYVSIPNLSKANFFVYSVLGQKVMEGYISSTSGEIDISKLDTGVYILQIEYNGLMSRKFTKH